LKGSDLTSSNLRDEDERNTCHEGFQKNQSHKQKTRFGGKVVESQEVHVRGKTDDTKKGGKF